MKIKTKRNYLLGFLLSTFLIIGIINVTIGEKTIIDTKPDISKLHTISLRSLFLGSGDFDTGFSWMRVNTGGFSLDILNGLIVGSGNSVSQGSKMVVIGGGEGNKIKDSNAGIAGGKNNQVESSNGAIGGGLGNRGDGVIAGGRENIAGGSAIVLGGRRNGRSVGIDYGNGIILGGSGNDAGYGAVVLGQIARGKWMSFAWNAKAGINSARIDASGGMLIGTYSPVSGVYLVVSGSVKLGSGKFNNTTGGIWVDGSGCIKASDGGVSYTLGRSSESVCGVDSGCQFGKTILHNGDKVTAYTVSYAKKCEDIAQTVTCKGGKFYNSGGSIMNVVYPYCYDLSPDPILTLTGGIKQCSGTLPANTIPVNEYFKQNLQNGEWTPPNKSRSYYYNDVNKECSYRCDTENGYSWNDAVHKCELQTYNCGGTKPTGNGYKFGTGIYTYGYTPTSWTYTSSSIPGACQYTCDSDGGWEIEPTSSKCIKSINASCGESHFNCKGEGSTATNQQTGRDGSTIKGWTWTCQGTPGGSNPECIECNTERGYVNLSGICVKLQCHHCSSNGFPYCFPINFNPTCNEGNYLN